MTPADRLLLLAVSIMLPFLYYTFWFDQQAASYLLIHNAASEARTEPLKPDRTLRLTGALGTSIIEISDGRARFKASPCPTQACVHSGWLTRSGEFSACLPNRISLELVSKHPYYDAINF